MADELLGKKEVVKTRQTETDEITGMRNFQGLSLDGSCEVGKEDLKGM